jgi:hypothetical protein
VPQSKLLPLSEAIAHFVADGSSVADGLCLEAMIHFT